MPELYPFQFRPVLKHYVWGGRRLADVLGKELAGHPTAAESWEVCARGDDESVVLFGPMAGCGLGDLFRRFGPELVGPGQAFDRFPLLFKFLDAAEPLSVQVHPNDALAARLVPPDSGKTEAWFVIDAAPDGLIFAGLRPGVDRARLSNAIGEGRVDETLHRFHARPGDCVLIPAGAVHALGRGVLIAELQQSSDTTFRLFDWNRVGPDGRPRPLHIAQGLDAVDFELGPIEPADPVPLGGPRQRLTMCPHFVWERWSIGDSAYLAGDGRMHIVAVIGGTARCPSAPGPARRPRGTTLLLPAGLGPTEFFADGGPLELLDGYLP